MNKPLVFSLSLALLYTDAAIGQEVSPDCASAEHRQLDFWLGEWDVYNAQAESSALPKPTASSRIESILDGCGIQEHFHAETGYSGTSLNRFDGSAGQWVQHWMDNRADGIDFTGTLIGNAMVFNASGFSDNNGTYVRRMQLISISTVEVHQLSDRSYDQGLTWFPEYRLTYRRKQN